MANQKNQGSNTGGINESGTGSQSTGGRGKQQPGSTGSTGNEGSFGGTPISNPSGSAGSSLSGAGSTGSTTSAAKTGSTPTTGTGSTSQAGLGSSGSLSTTAGSGGTGAAAARSLYDQAKETAGHAYEAAAEKATTKLEEQKSTLSGGLATVADSVRKVSENLRGPDVQDGIAKFTGEYSDVAARKIEGIANYFERTSVRDMYSDVEKFARRNPAVFVGSAFALGLVLSRFLKSGSASRTSGPGPIGSRSGHTGPISTASEHNSGQGIQGISGGEIPGASIS